VLAELLAVPLSTIQSIGVLASIPILIAFYREILWYWRLTRSALGYRRSEKGAERNRRFRNLVEDLAATIRSSANDQFEEGNLNKEEYMTLLSQLVGLNDAILHSPRGESWEEGFFAKRKLQRQDYRVITNLGNAITSLAGEPDSMFDSCSKSISGASEALNKRGLLVAHAGR